MKSTIIKEEVYQLAKENFGLVPGIIRELAERAAPVAQLYLQGIKIMEQSSLSEIEINAIELTISMLNHCDSCIKGHVFLLKKAGLSDDDVQAILRKDKTTVPRLNKLLTAAEYIYHSGSSLYPDLVLGFLRDEEITEQEVFEIIGLISLKTISNYTNNFLTSARQHGLKSKIN